MRIVVEDLFFCGCLRVIIWKCKLCGLFSDSSGIVLFYKEDSCLREV